MEHTLRTWERWPAWPEIALSGDSYSQGKKENERRYMEILSITNQEKPKLP